jgi:hypothetical protein
VSNSCKSGGSKLEDISHAKTEGGKALAGVNFAKVE